MFKNKFLIVLLPLLLYSLPSTPRQRASTLKWQTSQGRQNIQSAPQQIPQSAQTEPTLSQYNFGAASVLPVFTDKAGIKYLILSREARGTAQGTYDDFGGKRDPGENHPVVTAAREFFEEAILSLILGFSNKTTRDFIDLKANNTEYVIAFARNVTYITEFGLHVDRFFDNFYKALTTTTSKQSQEKDSIAVVRWDLLATTIAQTPYNTGIKMNAFVLNPSNQWVIEQIELRGFFVKKVRPFFMNQPYQPGMNKKIRFYDIVPTTPITPSTTTITSTIATAKKMPKKTLAQEIKVGPRPKKAWSTRLWDWLKYPRS